MYVSRIPLVAQLIREFDVAPEMILNRLSENVKYCNVSRYIFTSLSIVRTNLQMTFIGRFWIQIQYNTMIYKSMNYQ